MRQAQMATANDVVCEVLGHESGMLAVRQRQATEEDSMKSVPLGSIFQAVSLPHVRAVLAWTKEPYGYLALLPSGADADTSFRAAVDQGEEIEMRFTGERLKVSSGLLAPGRVLGVREALDIGGSGSGDDEVEIVGLPLPLEARQSIDENLHTGVRAIDVLTPIGRGQSMMIIGDRDNRGQRAIAADVLSMQRENNDSVHRLLADEGANGNKKLAVVSMYAAIGENHPPEELSRIATETASTVVKADPDDAASQFLSLNLCLGLAEHARDVEDSHVLVIVDNVRGLSEPMLAINTLALRLKMAEDASAGRGVKTNEGDGESESNDDDDMVMIDGMYVSARAAERRAFLSTQLQRTAKCIDDVKRMQIMEQAARNAGVNDDAARGDGGEAAPAAAAGGVGGGGSLTMLLMARSESRPATFASTGFGGQGSVSGDASSPRKKLSLKLEDVEKYNLAPEAKKKLIETIKKQAEAEARAETEAKEAGPGTRAAGSGVSSEDGYMASTSVVEEVKSICDGHIYLEPRENVDHLARRLDGDFGAGETAVEYALTAKESCPRIGSRAAAGVLSQLGSAQLRLELMQDDSFALGEGQATTDGRIQHRHAAARLMMLQDAGKPSSIETTAVLFVALQHGMFDTMPLSSIGSCCRHIEALLQEERADVAERVLSVAMAAGDSAVSDSLVADIRSIVDSAADRVEGGHAHADSL